MKTKNKKQLDLYQVVEGQQASILGQQVGAKLSSA